MENNRPEIIRVPLAAQKIEQAMHGQDHNSNEVTIRAIGTAFNEEVDRQKRNLGSMMNPREKDSCSFF